MAINFENQVVLVTGGTRGLGRDFPFALGQVVRLLQSTAPPVTMQA